MHDKVTLDMRWKILGTTLYFLLASAYFYTTKRSDTVDSPSILAPGNMTMGSLEIVFALAIGALVFGLLPGKKICKQCGYSWRF